MFEKKRNYILTILYGKNTTIFLFRLVGLGVFRISYEFNNTITHNKIMT